MLIGQREPKVGEEVFFEEHGVVINRGRITHVEPNTCGSGLFFIISWGGTKTRPPLKTKYIWESGKVRMQLQSVVSGPPITYASIQHVYYTAEAKEYVRVY